MRRVARLLFLSAIVLVSGIVAPTAVSAATVGPTPAVAVEPGSAKPGEIVEVSLTGWAAGTATLSVCGNLARRGSADCDVLGSRGALLGGGRLPYTELLFVTMPPAPCPCVIRAASTTQSEIAVAPFDVVGAPVAPVVEPLSAGPLIELELGVERVEQDLLPSVRSALGGRTRYLVRVSVRNLTTETLSDVTLHGSASHRLGDEVVGLDLGAPGPIEPGRSWEGVVEAELPAPAIGRYRWEVTASGAGPTVRATEGATSTPWLLVGLVVLLVGDGAAMLWRVVARRRRRRATRRVGPSLAGAGAVVAVAVAVATSMGAPTADAQDVEGPTVALDRPTAAPGEQVVVGLRAWSSDVVTLAVCGNRAERGTSDCNVVNSQGVRTVRDGDATAASFLVSAPPVPCPCVVRASSTEGDEVATAPLEVVGHPTGSTPRAPAALPGGEPLLDLSIDARPARVGLLQRLRAALGGPTTYDVTVAVRNLSGEVLSDISLSGSAGRSIGGVVATVYLPPLVALDPWSTWEEVVTVELPAPAIGGYTWQITASGTGPPARAEEQARLAPLGLLLLAAALVGDVVAMVVRAARARRARRPHGSVVSGATPPPALPGAAADRMVDGRSAAPGRPSSARRALAVVAAFGVAQWRDRTTGVGRGRSA